MDASSDHPTRNRRGLLIVLSSPSGAGKTTISRMLLSLAIRASGIPSSSDSSVWLSMNMG